MVLVHVQHFLDADGRQYFSEWVDEVREELRSFRGFRSLREIERVEAPDEMHLLLSFGAEPQLRRWAKSDAHDRLLARLEPYLRRVQDSTILRLPEPAE
jgi:antibiotic biosynthesis monooxygenase (ABM) superfamily enzyme